MAKHKRTSALGRHRRISPKSHRGLATATAAGLLTGALFVSGASAAEAADETPVSTEDTQPSIDEQSYVQQPGAGDVQSDQDQGSQSGTDGEQPYDQAQPGGDDQQPDTAGDVSAESEPADEGEQSGARDQSSADAESGTEDAQPNVAPGDKLQVKDDPTSWCSAGANVSNGEGDFIVTAGHCAAERGWTTDSNHGGRDIGDTDEVGPEGSDYSFVRNDLVPDPGTFTEVGDAYVGQDVCKHGATTDITCGKVTGLNKTVHYDRLVNTTEDGRGVYEIGPTVDGLIQTDLYSEGGDSGAPLYSSDGHSLLGVLSGGSADKDNPVSQYQPLSGVLAEHGLHLVTREGAGS
ncbi:trypsin-like serine protease [Streptomyces sp. NPDC005728]|uniref:S1 family peptidase n=1 Tax=Streptomyces sp. NPDC005728 TaxID=3157054 RepID=UPI0033F3AD21